MTKRASLGSVLMLLWTAYFAWMLFDRYVAPDPSEITERHFAKMVVRPGGDLDAIYTTDRHRVCQLDVEWRLRSLINGKIRRFSEPHTNVPGPVTKEVISRTIKVPNDFPVGPARFDFTLIWVCPPNVYEAVFPKYHTFPALDFTVVDNDKNT